MTWLDTEDTKWLNRARSWPLAAGRYVPASETWPSVGSYPSRKAAISAACGETQL